MGSVQFVDVDIFIRHSMKLFRDSLAIDHGIKDGIKDGIKMALDSSITKDPV